jgi:hypothetical protein
VRGTLPAVTSPDQAARRTATLSLLARLHRQKDAAYRDAWRKRGEVIGIFANIARKVDRLEVALAEERPAGAEPLGDTAADLCVYAAKYLTWLAETQPQAFARSPPSLKPAAASAERGREALEAVLEALERWEQQTQTTPPIDVTEAWARVCRAFEQLGAGLMAQATAGEPQHPLLGWPRKVELAWALTDAAAWLLERVAERDGSELERLRAEIAAMEERASR